MLDGVLEPVIDSAEIGMFSWNVADRSMRWTRHHYEIFDLPPELEITEAIFHARIHPDDLAGVDAAIAEALRTRADYRTRYRIRVSNGTVRYVRASGRFHVWSGWRRHSHERRRDRCHASDD